jgi:hypothetical protein
MCNRPYVAAMLLASLALLPAGPALAQGEIVITQSKAEAGGVTPDDAPGFPVTLSFSGAYIFASNLNVPAGKNGLVVAKHNVDIDMNGFRLNGGGVANIGVVSTYGQSRIHDGTITQFLSDGIRLTGNSNAWIVENMQIIQNHGSGVSADPSTYSRYLNNNIVVNLGDGISCGEYCHVEGNTIADNGNVGVYIRSGTVLGNSIFSNGNEAIHDWQTGFDTGFGNNTIVGNNGGGIQATSVTPLQPNVCKPTACQNESQPALGGPARGRPLSLILLTFPPTTRCTSFGTR